MPEQCIKEGEGDVLRKDVVVIMAVVGALVLDEICTVTLGATCVRLSWRALERGFKCTASVLTRTTRSLETRIAATLDALDGEDEQPPAVRRPRLQNKARRVRSSKNPDKKDEQQQRPEQRLPQRPPDTQLLSHENLLAHEKALVCRGDDWHDWHAVREHTQYFQSRRLDDLSSRRLDDSLSRNLSASPASTGVRFSLGRQEWPREQANRSGIFSTACHSISEETMIERERDVTREKQKETQETRLNAGPYHVVTPADIMARWNLGRDQQGMALAM